MSDTLRFVREIHEADRTVLDVVRNALPSIAAAADAIAARIRAGGRCIYLGAGTSGRLAVLDAAELPPTFGTEPELVSASIAGGSRAFTEAIEGAEDDEDAAGRDLAAMGLGAKDAVVAIAASGTTPYALAGLRRARSIGALGVAIACARETPLERDADLAIVLATGPEVVSGSTRMKAGTAQKIVLHTLSTAVMSALGRVYRGRMVAMRPTNAKLRERAVRIVVEVAGAPAELARRLLEEERWTLPLALLRARFGCSSGQASAHLERHGGSVAKALDDDPGRTPP